MDGGQGTLTQQPDQAPRLPQAAGRTARTNTVIRPPNPPATASRISVGGKRTALTLNQKVAAIRFKERRPGCKLGAVAAFIKDTFNLEVSQAALSMLMKNKEILKQRHARGNSFTNAQTRKRASPVESLNQALATWCDEQREAAAVQGVECPLTDDSIRQKAKDIASKISDFPSNPKLFNFSYTWLQNFKKRTGITQTAVDDRMPVAAHCDIFFGHRYALEPFSYGPLAGIITSSASAHPGATSLHRSPTIPVNRHTLRTAGRLPRVQPAFPNLPHAPPQDSDGPQGHKSWAFGQHYYYLSNGTSRGCPRGGRPFQ